MCEKQQLEKNICSTPSTLSSSKKELYYFCCKYTAYQFVSEQWAEESSRMFLYTRFEVGRIHLDIIGVAFYYLREVYLSVDPL